MPRLFLLRHAKSSWDDTALSDFDRPLNIRGRNSAPLMGRHMQDHHLIPDRVLCSSSRRTRDTFAGLLPFLNGDVEVKFLRHLYMAAEGDYLSLIAKHGEAAKALLVIGHNPAIQSTALALIGRGNPDLRKQIEEKFPTAALAVIDFDEADWNKVTGGSGRIVAFFRPRELELVGGVDGEVDD